jgi:hypothetical protein
MSGAGCGEQAGQPSRERGRRPVVEEFVAARPVRRVGDASRTDDVAAPRAGVDQPAEPAVVTGGVTQHGPRWRLEVEVQAAPPAADHEGFEREVGAVFLRQDREDVGPVADAGQVPSWWRLLPRLRDVEVDHYPSGRAGGDPDVVRGLRPGGRDPGRVGRRAALPADVSGPAPRVAASAVGCLVIGERRRLLRPGTDREHAPSPGGAGQRGIGQFAPLRLPAPMLSGAGLRAVACAGGLPGPRFCSRICPRASRNLTPSLTPFPWRDRTLLTATGRSSHP